MGKIDLPEFNPNTNEQTIAEIKKIVKDIRSSGGRLYAKVENNQLKETENPEEASKLKELSAFFFTMIENQKNEKDLKELEKSFIYLIKYYTKSARNTQIRFRKILSPSSLLGQKITKIISSVSTFITMKLAKKSELINELKNEIKYIILKNIIFDIRPKFENNPIVRDWN